MLTNGTQVLPYMSGCSHSFCSECRICVLISVIVGNSCSHEAFSHQKIENDAKAKISLVPSVFCLMQW